MTASCCASLRPNTATSAREALKSFSTTVRTPAKWIGRNAPHITFESFDSTSETVASAPYISSGVGAKTASTPSARRSAKSRFSSRGYWAKSSFGPNCVGFTKTETTTRPAFFFAMRTSERWPSWR